MSLKIRTPKSGSCGRADKVLFIPATGVITAFVASSPSRCFLWGAQPCGLPNIRDFVVRVLRCCPPPVMKVTQAKVLGGRGGNRPAINSIHACSRCMVPLNPRHSHSTACRLALTVSIHRWLSWNLPTHGCFEPVFRLGNHCPLTHDGEIVGRFAAARIRGSARA